MSFGCLSVELGILSTRVNFVCINNGRTEQFLSMADPILSIGYKPTGLFVYTSRVFFLIGKTIVYGTLLKKKH